MRCAICDAPASPFGTATILRRIPVTYFRCGDCHFVQTESPYWLEQAYAEPIAASDVGLVDRNRVTQEVKYFVSNVSVKPMVLVAFRRWTVEHAFRFAKSEVGLTHFEGRSYVGLMHHQL